MYQGRRYCPGKEAQFHDKDTPDSVLYKSSQFFRSCSRPVYSGSGRLPDKWRPVIPPVLDPDSLSVKNRPSARFFQVALLDYPPVCCCKSLDYPDRAPKKRTFDTIFSDPFEKEFLLSSGRFEYLPPLKGKGFFFCAC